MFRSIIRQNIRRYCIKQLHSNTWSVVYVDLLVIIRVMICYTGSSGLRQTVADMEAFIQKFIFLLCLLIISQNEYKKNLLQPLDG
jgi:hypothetical protein